MILQKHLWIYLFMIMSCHDGTPDRVSLSGEYCYRPAGRYGMIVSTQLNYYKTVYADVIDYNYDSNYIIAEQKPKLDNYITFFSDNLLRRFQFYSFYIKDTIILKQKEYEKYKGVVEKDSIIFNNFIAAGAGDDESKNRTISVRLTENLFKTDPFYIDLLNGRSVYWIISHEIKEILGPYSRREYLEKKKELNIPTSLKLKFEK